MQREPDSIFMPRKLEYTTTNKNTSDTQLTTNAPKEQNTMAEAIAKLADVISDQKAPGAPRHFLANESFSGIPTPGKRTNQIKENMLSLVRYHQKLIDFVTRVDPSARTAIRQLIGTANQLSTEWQNANPAARAFYITLIKNIPQTPQQAQNGPATTFDRIGQTVLANVNTVYPIQTDEDWTSVQKILAAVFTVNVSLDVQNQQDLTKLRDLVAKPWINLQNIQKSMEEWRVAFDALRTMDRTQGVLQEAIPTMINTVINALEKTQGNEARHATWQLNTTMANTNLTALHVEEEQLWQAYAMTHHFAAYVKIESSETNNAHTAKKTTEVCRNFRNGRCTNGDNCRYLHTKPENNKTQAEKPTNNKPKGTLTGSCPHWLKGKCVQHQNGKCNLGEHKEALKGHTKGQKCFMFAKGTCSRGDKCAYVHESTDDTKPRVNNVTTEVDYARFIQDEQAIQAIAQRAIQDPDTIEAIARRAIDFMDTPEGSDLPAINAVKHLPYGTTGERRVTLDKTPDNSSIEGNWYIDSGATNWTVPLYDGSIIKRTGEYTEYSSVDGVSTAEWVLIDTPIGQRMGLETQTTHTHRICPMDDLQQSHIVYWHKNVWALIDPNSYQHTPSEVIGHIPRLFHHNKTTNNVIRHTTRSRKTFKTLPKSAIGMFLTWILGIIVGAWLTQAAATPQINTIQKITNPLSTRIIDNIPHGNHTFQDLKPGQQAAIKAENKTAQEPITTVNVAKLQEEMRDDTQTHKITTNKTVVEIHHNAAQDYDYNIQINTTAARIARTIQHPVVLGTEVACAQHHHQNTKGNACIDCARASIRRHQHCKVQDSLRETGDIAVDLCQLENTKDFLLVAVHHANPKAVRSITVQSPTKSAENIATALEEAVLTLEQQWKIPLIKRIHPDQEKGLLAIRTQWSKRGVRISTTLGHDPQGNGHAEREIGVLTQMARKRLSHVHDPETKRFLWPWAMRHAADTRSIQQIATTGSKLPFKLHDLLPFGTAVIYAPTQTPETKLDHRGKTAIYLAPSRDVSRAACVLEISSGKVEGDLTTNRQPTLTKVMRPIHDKNGNPILPDVRLPLTATQQENARTVALKCTKCGTPHNITRKMAQDHPDGVHCAMFQGRMCGQQPRQEVAKRRVGRPMQIAAGVEQFAKRSVIKDTTRKLEEESLDCPEVEKIEQNLPTADILRIQLNVTKLCDKNEEQDPRAKEARKTEAEKIFGRFQSIDSPEEYDEVIRNLQNNNTTATISRAHIITSI